MNADRAVLGGFFPAGYPMRDKTVLITGANTGIGKATALGLARLGARLVLGCRSLERSEPARAEIAAGSGNAEVHLRPLDLGSFASIRRFAEGVLGEFDRLDVLINNAAVFPSRLRRTEEGFEAQFGVNHLGHFLLTRLLVDRLVHSAPARVIHVTSMLHARGEIDFGSFRGQKRYRPMKAYYQSKLANLLFSNELARRLEGTGVTSNALHPGPIRSELMRDALLPVRLYTRLFFRPVEEGAETPVFLASDPAVEGVSGRYFIRCRERSPGALALDRGLAERLWKESAALCGLSS